MERVFHQKKDNWPTNKNTKKKKNSNNIIIQNQQKYILRTLRLDNVYPALVRAQNIPLEIDFITKNQLKISIN